MDYKNCETKLEGQNEQSQTSSSKRKNKKSLLIILIIFILAIFICVGVLVVNFIKKTFSRYNGELHKYEEFIDYVDNLEYDFNGKEYSCNLKNKYEKVSEKIDFDKENKKIKTITFRIKGTDLTFSVKSFLECTSGIDDSCFKYTYKLSDDFTYRAFDYYISEYNKMIGYNDKYCHSVENSCMSGAFNIKSYDDLEYVINYMNGFLNYANTIDFKFMDRFSDFNINFEEISKSGSYHSFYIKFDIVDNKYTYKFEDKYMPADGKIETYIKNYMDANKIILK